MEEKKKTVRPTKKQKELLSFIEEFIAARGYSPSYREIMHGLQYTSVATVALHVNNLIVRGHLQKRDRSARSLEVVQPTLIPDTKVRPKQLKASEEKWLIEKIEMFIKDTENSPRVETEQLDNLYILVGALRVLGVSGAAQSFAARLSELKKRISDNKYTT